MRRIAIALILAAAVAGIYACSADAPTAPRPGSGGGTTSSAVSVQLFTSDANPKAGTCTLLEALVTLNGVNVPDGTSVNFSTDFGTFGQNGLPLVSVVTTNGSAVTALCGPGAGTAKVKATATIAGKTNSANISISFQPDSGTLPFVSFCNPSFGPKDGGTQLVLNGGRFFGSPSTTRVQFTVNGISKDGVVTGVTSTTVTVQTPSFTEVGAPTAPAAITLILGTNQPVPVALSLPSCFTYGIAESSTPIVTAVLPSSGTKAGNTRVTIIGSGFSTSGAQVFFGGVEATVISVSFNQIVVLSPPAPFNQAAGPVQVTVRNISSGVTSGDNVTFTYTPDMHITAIANGTQSIGQPFTSVTIFGTGFLAPVAVTLAGVPAFIQSVAATEIVVVPGLPIGCGGGVSGQIVVVNITSGETATSDPSVVFTYVGAPTAVTNVIPQLGQAGDLIELDGTNLPTSVVNTQVLFNSRAGIVQSANGTVITVTAPPGTVTTNPTCTGTNPAGTLQVVETVPISVTNIATTCNVVAAQSFSYELPCVIPAP
jgi:hypothetical protein